VHYRGWPLQTQWKLPHSAEKRRLWGGSHAQANVDTFPDT